MNMKINSQRAQEVGAFGHVIFYKSRNINILLASVNAS